MNQESSDLSRRAFVTTVAGLSLAAVSPLSVRAWPTRSPDPQSPRKDYGALPFPLCDVEITDAFWSPRIDKARTVSLPIMLDRSASEARHMDGRLIEAASYFMAKQPDPVLLAKAQKLFSPMIAGARANKQVWPNVADGPFMGAGHFFEAAVAYYQTTGSRELLDVAIEVADDLNSVYGPGKRTDISNHEGIELSLVKLYRVTGDEKYVRLARFITDTRGTNAGGRAMTGYYAQDHQPVKEQTRAIGHCVRATYLYNAVADLAALTDDPGYQQASLRIWDDAAGKRTYVTGGIGSYRHEEDYGDDYDLPNASCWNEICAAVGNSLWNQRMFQLTQQAKYIDMMERILYNGMLAGVSLSGEKFLYQAPLKAFPTFERQARFGPNCCPPNITRLLGELGTMVYAGNDGNLFVNLFIGSRARFHAGSTPVAIAQETKYPWDGTTRITIDPAAPVRFAANVRIPGWAQNEPMPGGLYRYDSRESPALSLTVNGKAASYEMKAGYARIEREWSKGDVIGLNLPMPVVQVRAKEEVADDRGMVALERGPLVFCVEAIDNDGSAFDLLLPPGVQFQFSFRPELLEGVGTIRGDVQRVTRQPGGAIEKHPHTLTAIPYYAFGNRSRTETAVWLAGEESRAVVAPAASIASASVATSSCANGSVADNYPGHHPPTPATRMYPSSQDGSGSISAIQDQLEPVNSEDGSAPFLRLRPQSGDRAWVQYDFAKPTSVSSVSVYWKDDKQYCLLPAQWRLVYKDGGEWIPVKASRPFGVEKDKYNRVAFAPVTTPSLRMEIQLQPNRIKKGKLGPPDANYLTEDLIWYEGGVIEWSVDA